MIRSTRRCRLMRSVRMLAVGFLLGGSVITTHAQTTGPGTDENLSGTANKGKARTETVLNLETQPAELYVGYHGKKELKIKIADSIPGTESPTLGSIPNGRVTFWNGAGDTATQIYSVSVNSSSYVSVWVRGESVSSAAGADRVKLGSKEIPLTVVKVDFGGLVAVYEGDTADLGLTVFPSPPKTSISLMIFTVTGTGSAAFGDGTTTSAVTDSTTVTVRGISVSGTENNIMLWANVNGSQCGVKTFSVIKVKLQEVSFLGTGQHTLLKTGTANYKYGGTTFASDGNTTITNPVWKDADLDGNVNGASDKDDPICFSRGAHPTVSAKVAISPTLTGKVPAHIRVIAPSGTPEVVFFENDVDLEGASQGFSAALGTSFCTAIDCFDWCLGWDISVNGRPCVDFGASKHLVFVTYGTPCGDNAVTAQRMQWATSTCVSNGGTSDLSPGNIPRAMQRGISFDGIGHFGSGSGAALAANPWPLLDPGITGPCVIFALLMKCGLNMLGVPVAQTGLDNVTSEPVADVTEYLGVTTSTALPPILRCFRDWLSPVDAWLNEGVCRVDTDGGGSLFYDVLGLAYGPKAGPSVGAQYPTRTPDLVDNMWREPEPSHGPVMKDWLSPPLYSTDWLTTVLPLVKVASPNGGEVIPIGTVVTVRFFTAGLQGLNLDVYYRNLGTGMDTKIGTVTVAAAATRQGNFSKASTLLWDTAAKPAGQYLIRVQVPGAEPWHTFYFDWSDAPFNLQ